MKTITSEPSTIQVLKHSSQFRTTQTVIERTNKLNSRNKAILISMFDFFSLCTNIPHRKLKSVMGELINFYFSSGDREFIGITRHGAIWTKSRPKYRLSFKSTSLKVAITYLLDRFHFTLGSTSLSQLIKVIMASETCPFYGKLFSSNRKRDLRQS